MEELSKCSMTALVVDSRVAFGGATSYVAKKRKYSLVMIG